MLTWQPTGLAQEVQQTPTDAHEHISVTAPLLTPTKETSGTGWLPSVTPMYGVHRPWRGWDVRLNGLAFAQALYQSSDRSGSGGSSSRRAGSISWGMMMARRNIAGGRFGIRTMFSAEPWTVPSCGIFNTLTTGEGCDGNTLHGRRQRHDLFMELAVDYDRVLRGAWRWQIYGGLVGEPALGPPGYPHRASAIANPFAPLTHEWLDYTHVSYGLLTVGVHNQRWKLETSAFNGREFDRQRTDFDLGALDSLASRVSFLPTERLALQVSAARLREARADFPLRSQNPASRLTASAVYHVPLRANGIWATTLALGRVRAGGIPSADVPEVKSVAVLLESSVSLSTRHTVFGRGELGRIPAHHLHLPSSASSLALSKVQLGYVRHLPAMKGLQPGLGATVSFTVVPSALSQAYALRGAPNFGLFLSLQAARHQM